MDQLLGQMFTATDGEIVMRLRGKRVGGISLAREERGRVSARCLPDGCGEEILDVIIAQLASLQGDEIVQEDVEVLDRLDSPQGGHCGGYSAE